MQKSLEYKSFQSFLTKEIEGNAVTGLAAIFGNVDSQNDITHRGAFKKTIAESKGRVRHLWQHDSQYPPVAVIKELAEVGRGDLPDVVKERYPEAKGGLLVTREYLDTPRGNEVLAGIKAGAITEMSFGFNALKYDFEQVGEGKESVQVRNLREIRLWDTSDVNWGANEATVAAKSALDFKLMKLAEYAGASLLDLRGEAGNAYEFLKANLGQANLPQLTEQIEELLQFLRAEPPKALTPIAEVEALFRRLDIAERESELLGV